MEKQTICQLINQKQKAQSINQKLQNNMNNLQIKESAQKKLYEITTCLGKLTIQIIKFQFYVIVIVCYSSVLKLDGFLQVGFITPYNENPTVLNLAKDQGQFDSQNICQSLSKTCKNPVFLSLNIQIGSKKDQQQLIKVLNKSFIKVSTIVCNSLIICQLDDYACVLALSQLLQKILSIPALYISFSNEILAKQK